ncbi:1336_t:CDS:2 [Racocetra fulgida]|uniref:1336_t:CDS:1 n=1 Tax=Racocetra fulgida TaxID=60492 RepID=A0A9N9DUJ2_9GLOM|nr:1336_t:CDS:2 [Racocetra fulgida]
MCHNIESGEKIQEAIKDLAGTHVTNIMPNCEGWALAENEKNNQREPWKRITEQIRNLLENMFHMGIADSKNKFTGQEIHDELLKWAQCGEFDQSDIPKVTTINNWIATFTTKPTRTDRKGKCTNTSTIPVDDAGSQHDSHS